MPDIKVSNKTSEVLNIGFRIVTPIAFINEVQPSQTISLHLASFLHGFEARRDNGFNRFSADESWRKAGELGGAIAAGTASVLAGTAWALGTFGRSGPLSSVALASAGAAWGAACQGGTAYATPAEAVVVHVPRIWIPLEPKNFSVRFIDGRYVLWDEDGDHLVG